MADILGPRTPRDKALRIAQHFDEIATWLRQDRIFAEIVPFIPDQWKESLEMFEAGLSPILPVDGVIVPDDTDPKLIDDGSVIPPDGSTQADLVMLRTPDGGSINVAGNDPAGIHEPLPDRSGEFGERLEGRDTANERRDPERIAPDGTAEDVTLKPF